MNRSISFMLTLSLIIVLAVPALAGEDCKDKTFGFTFGGYLKTDLIYDMTRMSPGNYALYVPTYEGDNNSELFLTARESRLGFDFWWKDEDWTTKAYMEFDWQNAGGGENKAGPMLRHAYMKFGKCNWTILAGQTWDIISPLNPATANYSVLWYQGNIGYRRAQVRFTTWADAGENGKIKFDAGLFRNITGNRWDVDPAEDGMVEDGADSGLPTVQGRLGIATKIGDEGKLSLGVSGHFGKETYGVEDEEEVDSWSFNTDLAFAVNKKISLKGEFFVGENMKQYLGGIGQSYNPIGEALPTMGGWGMISLKPKSCVTFNIGYGFDDPDEAEWTCPDDIPTEAYELRDLNSEFFGNVFYNINRNITAIFEVAFMKTEYLSRENDGTDITDTMTEYDNMRFQFALKCAFK
ncbi:MAG: hypothetical protein KAV42_09000 [Candidatus Krumholzibacteria bacterium]|nr:hypothetical protein [Candidatus Krumholzibacteria bacterium]